MKLLKIFALFGCILLAEFLNAQNDLSKFYPVTWDTVKFKSIPADKKYNQEDLLILNDHVVFKNLNLIIK